METSAQTAEVAEKTEEAVDAPAFIAEHGLEAVADLRVEAHGSVYSVREALVECEPFAKMVMGLAVSLESLPEESRGEILTNSIRAMASSAAETPAFTQKKTTF